ncbi:unnamed protein product [Knipowitschia caucasica]
MTLVFQPGNSSGIKPLFCFASSSVVVSPEPCFSLSVEGLTSAGDCDRGQLQPRPLQAAPVRQTHGFSARKS